MRNLFLGTFCTAVFFSAKFYGQNIDAEKPRLVVGIVVDQMRNDFIYRYWDRYGSGGFKRLVQEGYYFRNAHFNYVPTYTGPGHASIYTGTFPRHHGIIANNWYNKQEKRKEYCVYDHSVKPVGTESDAGKMSPHRELTNTIGDELKLATVNRGKVFAVALKDRGAVLPAGHAADAAFWFDESTGNFVSSSWYLQQLPGWLKEFNGKKQVQAYLSKPWNTLYPITSYTNSLPDDNQYESLLLGKDKPVFPYDFSGFLKNNQLSVIRSTPYGNSITKDIAIACIVNENLGKDHIPDLISISFSSPDVIGHDFGPRSVEIEDTYLRLDKDIAEILDLLDREVGKGKYTVFLTADHGAGDVSSHLADEQMHAGYVYHSNIARTLRDFCGAQYQDTTLIASVSNEQVFLNLSRVSEMRLDQDLLESQICVVLVGLPGIAAAYPSKILRYGAASPDDRQLQLLQNGYNFKLSGHVAFVPEPGFADHSRRGATHGSAYVYDTHVPLIFYGTGISRGEQHGYTSITQIVPTIAELLRIARPAAAMADPLNSFFR